MIDMAYKILAASELIHALEIDTCIFEFALFSCTIFP